jgi:manganese/zinc/iron transport system substrate-binding protein
LVVLLTLAAGLQAEQPTPVVATTTIVADLVRQVGGDRVAVDCLMGPGIDPHSYRATPRDADRLARAKLIVASGLHLEGKLSELLARLGRRVPVTAVADTLPSEQLLPVTDTLHDPHVWFDARLWSRCVPAVVEALAKLDPGGREHFQARAADAIRRLESLDDRLRDRLASIPKQQRVLVTAHDAFRYFVEVLGVQGTSTESEAGLADINRLVETIVARKIPAVFVETSVSDRNVTALREGARARGHAVALGGQLYSDALGGPGSGAETLEAMLLANVETIHAGLTGGR